MEQTVIDSELLTRMVQNTNNLLESLDFKGIFSLLKSQIDKTEKLHVTIPNIREENFVLRKAIYSECNNQALKDRPVLKSSSTWQKPDKTFKPTTSFPACNPVTTSN